MRFAITAMATRGLSESTTSKMQPLGWERLSAATSADNAAIEEQLGHKLGRTLGCGGRCKYGYPQAALIDLKPQKVEGHLVRLTCPHLCQYIDEWEAEGAVDSMSKKLKESREWQDALAVVNKRHATTRRSLVRAEAIQETEERLGKGTCDIILNSGIAGVSPLKLNDIKCVHAHVADELLTGANALGKAFLDELSVQGCTVTGSDVCHQHCSGLGPWKYIPIKNKQKLWTTKHRRRVLKSRRSKSSSDGDHHRESERSENSAASPPLADPSSSSTLRSRTDDDDVRPPSPSPSPRGIIKPRPGPPPAGPAAASYYRSQSSPPDSNRDDVEN